ncbi:hypothetical protein EDD15DRAFT_2365544 [Pisolithus albus]|nr:hypothetical protein EDD15DRAFT_2365544 [Pisolithus albus]
MDRVPLDIVRSLHRFPCVSYPTFAQVLTQLDVQQPHFRWSPKFSQPLTCLLGGRSINEVTVDALYFMVPNSLCVVFDLHPVWVMDFCVEALSALECARVDAHHSSEEAANCPSCGGYLMRYLDLALEF